MELQLHFFLFSIEERRQVFPFQSVREATSRTKN